MGESVTLTRDMLHAAGKESGSGAGGKRWSD
jgi:hypothetical protein